MEGLQIRALIGKGGETIRELRNRSGADIKIDHLPSDPQGTVAIIGDVPKTEALIREALAAKGLVPGLPGQQPPLPGPPGGMQPEDDPLNDVTIPHEFVGPLIGPGGASIKEIRAQCGNACFISILPPVQTNGPQLVRIVGDRREEAKRIILKKLEEFHSSPQGQRTMIAGGCGGGSGSRPAGVVVPPPPGLGGTGIIEPCDLSLLPIGGTVTPAKSAPSQCPMLGAGGMPAGMQPNMQACMMRSFTGGRGAPPNGVPCGCGDSWGPSGGVHPSVNQVGNLWGGGQKGNGIPGAGCGVPGQSWPDGGEETWGRGDQWCGGQQWAGKGSAPLAKGQLWACGSPQPWSGKGCPPAGDFQSGKGNMMGQMKGMPSFGQMPKAPGMQASGFGQKGGGCQAEVAMMQQQW